MTKTDQVGILTPLSNQQIEAFRCQISDQKPAPISSAAPESSGAMVEAPGPVSNGNTAWIWVATWQNVMPTTIAW